ncbi:ACP S-malonyltransferase [Planctellipticum variicoloris]|uniref:ACP S-malonyltransferase n=1 Tax=Planctellipticum variicoloris TaxID=3064265 RepID=UPI0030132A94|nr:ACP S-malonyltransferase [Planctomycetaceae bacterium SH412]
MSQIAFLFPGQGAQHVGMGKTIAERFPAARRLYDQAREILGYDLADLCFNGPAERLDATVISQPALFVSSLAALELLREQNPAAIEGCSHAAGLSLGEYTALVFAGAMTFEDGLRVVKRRGEAMQAAADANPSGMVSALLLDREKVEQVREGASVAGQIWIANYLCPGNTVLSGEKPACAKAVEVIEQIGGKPIPLTVAGAFHTPLMQSACSALDEALRGVTIQPPRIPVVSNVDARSHSDPEEIRQLLVRQVVQPVLWEDSVRALLAAGATQFFEVGPGKVLKGLMKRIDRKLDCQSINDTP